MQTIKKMFIFLAGLISGIYAQEKVTDKLPQLRVPEHIHAYSPLVHSWKGHNLTAVAHLIKGMSTPEVNRAYERVQKESGQASS